MKTNPLSGVAFRVTGWPGLYVAVQVPGQLMPSPDTVPLAGGCTVSCGRAVTWMPWDATALWPSGKVAVTLTWYVRAAAHWWLVCTPLPVCPSPNVQAAPVGCGPPAAAWASSTTVSPTSGPALEKAICTSGTPGGGGGGDGGDGGDGGWPGSDGCGCGPGG